MNEVKRYEIEADGDLIGVDIFLRGPNSKIDYLDAEYVCLSDAVDLLERDYTALKLERDNLKLANDEARKTINRLNEHIAKLAPEATNGGGQ